VDGPATAWQPTSGVTDLASTEQGNWYNWRTGDHRQVCRAPACVGHFAARTGALGKDCQHVTRTKDLDGPGDRGSIDRAPVQRYLAHTSQEPTEDAGEQLVLDQRERQSRGERDEHRAIEQADVIRREDDRTGARNVCLAMQTDLPIAADNGRCDWLEKVKAQLLADRQMRGMG